MADPGEVEVREAFARFRAETIAHSPAPDIARVRGIARRRQITRRTTLSMVALALLAVPAVGYRLAVHEAEVPAQPDTPQVVSGAPSERPPDEPSSAASTSSATVQKAVTRDDIMTATLAIPAWPEKWEDCPTGDVDIDRPGGDQPLTVGKVVSVDVDQDGDSEGVAIFSCGYEAGVDQALAIGRNQQGELRTVGRVVTGGANSADKLMDLLDLRTGDGGAIGVYVGDKINTVEPLFVERQWRSYRWNGRQFTQVDGPREFTPTAPSTDLALSVATTPFVPSDGGWSSTVTATLGNEGPNDAPGVYLDLYVTTADSTALTRQLRITSDCTVTDVRPDSRLTGVHLVCRGQPLAGGAGRDVKFQVRLPEANGARALSVVAFVYAEQPGVRLLNDLGGQPNSSVVTIAAPGG